jgi:hypothetical protein
MDEEHNNCNLGSPMVKGTKKPAHVQFGDNLDDALMGMFKMWYIVKRKNHACDELNDKKKKGYTACVIPYFVFVFRNRFLFYEISYLVNVVSFPKPVFKPWAVQLLFPSLPQ